MSTAGTGFLGVAILGLIGGSVYNIWTVHSAVGSDDNKKDMKKALYMVMIINTVLVLVFGMVAVGYLSANPTAERPYILMITHFSLFLSLTAASAAAIQKLDLSTVNLASSTAGGSNCG